MYSMVMEESSWEAVSPGAGLSLLSGYDPKPRRRLFEVLQRKGCK